ncbi:MAG: rod shape-determining protein MreC, partial [Bryobacteraceae bacterium]
MESFLSRYRNLTVLLIVIAGQLLLLAYQVRTNRDVRLIRVWTVSTVTPMAQVLEAVRQNTFGLVENYFVLLGVREENQKLRQELGQQKIQNHFLRTELSTADRAKALAAFAQETPSKTIAARIIGDGTGPNSATVFVDRGSGSGIERGMAAITPDGIVGKVVEAYPTASLVQLITDPAFAAGVVSQKNHIHGTLKGLGHSQVIVDYVQNEEKVDVGEWFYTSGYDRVFPRGFPVGQASVVRNGRSVKEIYIRPSGLIGGLEEVLIVLRGVHQAIPDNAPSSTA